MANTSLVTEALSIRFGGHVAVNQVSCAFKPGELTVIVGPNGAGKTTYFNLISGQLAATSGQVLLNGEDVTTAAPSKRALQGIGRAFQMTNLFPQLSVRENIRLAVQAQARVGWNPWVKVETCTDLENQAQRYLALVKLEEVADVVASTLPHGDQRKLEMAMLMAMEPDVYMFDEPTAGMSVDSAPAVLNLIADIKQKQDKIVLLVEHKMEVVSALADRILVLHNGEIIADGEPKVVMNNDLVRDVYLGKAVEVVS